MADENIPFGYRKLAAFFNRRASKVADFVSLNENILDQEINKRMKRAKRAVVVNQVTHVLGPIAMLGAIIATGGGAIPIFAAIGAWGAMEVGSASYTFKSSYEGQALEEKKKKLFPPAP